MKYDVFIEADIAGTYFTALAAAFLSIGGCQRVYDAYTITTYDDR